jgi:hypothetical protein
MTEVGELFSRSLEELEEELYDEVDQYLATKAKATAELRLWSDVKSRTSALAALVRSSVDRRKADIHETVCIELDYCVLIKSDRAQLALQIANLMMAGKVAILTGIPVSPLKLGVYIVRKHILDPFCRCPPSKLGGGRGSNDHLESEYLDDKLDDRISDTIDLGDLADLVDL